MIIFIVKSLEGLMRISLELPIVQILVVVVIRKMRFFFD